MSAVTVEDLLERIRSCAPAEAKADIDALAAKIDSLRASIRGAMENLVDFQTNEAVSGADTVDIVCQILPDMIKAIEACDESDPALMGWGNVASLRNFPPYEVAEEEEEEDGPSMG